MEDLGGADYRISYEPFVGRWYITRADGVGGRIETLEMHLVNVHVETRAAEPGVLYAGSSVIRVNGVRWLESANATVDVVRLQPPTQRLSVSPIRAFPRVKML